MTKISSIYNYFQLSDTLVTAGQPTEEELGSVAKEGYEVVVNLALSDADYSLPNEKRTVNELGMEYVHIPVIWQNPTENDLEEFFDIMEKYKHKKLFVHCAANMRVSIFIALYRIIKEDWDYNDAVNDIHKIWVPNAVWSGFMHSELLKRKNIRN